MAGLKGGTRKELRNLVFPGWTEKMAEERRDSTVRLYLLMTGLRALRPKNETRNQGAGVGADADHEELQVNYVGAADIVGAARMEPQWNHY